MAESTIIMTKLGSRLDPTIRKAAMSFLEKLAADDALPGLHIEPITNSVDPRARTGRVDHGNRAVLFRLDHGDSPAYVFLGVWPHNEGTAMAQRSVLRVNPLNGIPELTEVEIPEQTPRTSEPTASSAPESDLPRVLGYTADELVSGIGMDQRLAQRAAACVSEDLLLEMAGQVTDWQGLALVDLATGDDLQTIKERYDMTPREDNDAVILDQIRNNPATRASFTYVGNQDEMRAIIEGGDFDAWRVWLHPEQRRRVDANYRGPARITGGAGTGKTVVLLHRTHRLWKDNPEARILLTTFTTNLADEMREQLGRLDPKVTRANGLNQSGIFVSGIDALVAAILRTAGDRGTGATMAVLGHDSSVLRGRTRNDAWQNAIDAAGHDLPPQLPSDAFFVAEYATVILPSLVTSENEYLRVRRPGRGVRLARADRQAVWKVVAAYRTAARVNESVDFTEAAAIAARYLDDVAAESGRLFDHVVVDEGQDLGPTHLTLIRALVAEGDNDVFIAEDAHQRIYGQRLVLSQYGLQIRGRSSRLRLNYRTTKQNLGLAQRILEGAEWVDSENESEDSSGYRSVFSGPVPQLRGCSSLVEEYQFAADTLRRWIEAAGERGEDPKTLAILVRDRIQRDQVVTALGERGLTVRGLDRESIPAGKPVVMTMHRAKGTEFARVLLFGVSASSIPKTLRAFDYADDEKADALLRERALLYVAATRARDELVITWSGDGSRFLPAE